MAILDGMTTQTTDFVARVERFLSDHGFKASELGRLAVRDPSFVKDLRCGRSPRLKTVDKVIKFIEHFETRADRKVPGGVLDER